ncbi:MAG TPA: pilus assembly protein PilM, partial [Solirubrobacterales bacterium]
RRDMVASFVEPIRRAGLHPVGVDLSSFAMIRALAGVEPTTETGERPAQATLYCNLGDSTNLAVARGTACLFTRVSHVGLAGISEQLAASRGLTPEHATQWLAYAGLERPVEEIQGDPETLAEARRALEGGVTALIDELRLSLDYYGAQEAAVPVEQIVLSGHGSAIPGLPARMEAGLGLKIVVARPAALANLQEAAAARLTVPFGLALDS